MTEQPDLIRYGVLGALLRGMAMSYCARAEGISLEQARRIAAEAGWPDDMAAVFGEHRRLREELGLNKPRPPAAPPARRPRPPAPDPTRYLAHTPARALPELQQRPAPASSEVAKQESAEVGAVVPAAPEPAPEPATAPVPVAAPCEVCGATVSAAYIAKTGRARHGHHPEDAG